MQFQTPVSISPLARSITYADRMLLLGSCFSDAMFSRFEQHYFRAVSNPLGTLYNPVSIAQALSLRPSDHLPLVEYNGLFHSMDMHGAFSFANPDEAISACNLAIRRLQQAWTEASVVILTFGSAYVYEYEGVVVANCHKLPASMFVRRRLSKEEIVDVWRPVLAAHPDKHFIFTVSPIRHLKDGLHENALSKSTLLLAIDELVHDASGGDVSYFPSYEILLDELRDYRFYADDMLHPSSKAVDYIWLKFTEAAMSSDTRNEMRALYQLYLDRHHVLLHPDSPEAQRFMREVEERTMSLREHFPWIV